MKKKWIALFMTVLMLCALAVPALAIDTAKEKTARLCPDFTIVMDGEKKYFKRADGTAAFPLVYQDSTYLPLRAIGEALGKNVNWDETTKTISLEGTRTANTASNQFVEGTAKNVTVQVRKDFTIRIDGVQQQFMTSAGKEMYPLLYDGSTYLPLRAIGQMMNKTVTWDNATKTVTLTTVGFTVTDADSFGNTSPNSDAAGDINLAQAKAIALKHAGLQENAVTFVTTKVDYENGRKYYDVEFYYNGQEYDYEIDAKTGEITEFDKDFEGVRPIEKEPVNTTEITKEKAKNIALNHAGLAEAQVTRLKIEKDRDDGRVKYEIEFYSGLMEYGYEIDAATGNILKAEKEYDD